ncbi:MAG: site-specific integrase [Chloroflexi bacterium]|nr:site-specific integrase [Chloroflexota bacterium]
MTSKRRGDGEGSVFRRQDGRWVASISLGYENGKRRRKAFYADTRREVIAKKTAALRSIQQGEPLSDDSVTVGGFLTRWLNDSAKPTLRPRSFASYEMIVRRHLVPVLGASRLAKLRPAAVQAYMNAKLETGLSARSVQYHHAVLRRALNQAVRWGIVTRNVASLVSPPRVIRPEVRPLTPEQARSFLDAAAGDPMEHLYALALALGLRQGEALGLVWDDIDLDAGTLSVRRTLQRYGGAYHLDEPKTVRSRRTIGMPVQLVTVLRDRRRRQLEDRVKAGPIWNGDDWDLVFTNEIGEPLYGGTVTRRFQALLKSSGLPRQKFHDLRHATASFMLAQMVPMRVVMEVLGHSQIHVTMDTYAHVMPDLQRDATERVSATIFGAS